MAPRSTTPLSRARDQIAAEVRRLRRDRGWTLEDLALPLELSVSRLSEIERGGGSFTAEQFLLILKLFNVPASRFSPSEGDNTTQVQNALARLGASHLHESSDILPSEWLVRAHEAIREALVDGSPRVIVALAPVLARNATEFSLARLQTEMVNLGLENRLGWVVANTVAALENVISSSTHPRRHQLALAAARLSALLDSLRRQRDVKPPVEDILDATIRSERTLEQVRKSLSNEAREWKVVTSIQPNDFVDALRESLGSN